MEFSEEFYTVLIVVFRQQESRSKNHTTHVDNHCEYRVKHGENRTLLRIVCNTSLTSLSTSSLECITNNIIL